MSVNDFKEIGANELSPEDYNLLVSLGGPIYAESRMIEKMSGDMKSPVLGGYDDGSSKIRRGLENVRQRVIQRSPAHIQPPPPPQPLPQMVAPQPTQPAPQVIQPPVETLKAQEPTPQLEFNFNQSEQERTNNLLETISKQLTKVITLLESNNEQQREKSKIGK